jgi:plasmid maintenance system killer protein
MMKIDFDDTALEELYTTGSTQDKKYARLPEDIVKRYVKVVNYLKAGSRIEDLYLIKSLHYERKGVFYRESRLCGSMISTGCCSSAGQMKMELS